MNSRHVLVYTVQVAWCLIFLLYIGGVIPNFPILSYVLAATGVLVVVLAAVAIARK